MAEKIKIREAVIVEGKYDKIKLDSIIDGMIIQTDGFQIFSNKEKMDLIRRIAEKRGILVFTDSDSAGFLIRNHLNGAVAKDKIKHAYIPDVFGKERRKVKFSKEGKLGVEGISKEVIVQAILRSGAHCEMQHEKDVPVRSITKLDLFEDGFSGREDSAQRRQVLLSTLNLPERLTANALVDVLNCLMSYEEYHNMIGNLKFCI